MHSSSLLDEVVDHMQRDEALIGDMAKHTLAQVHEVMKRNAMLMPTVAGAVGLGATVAAIMLSETVTFAKNSMEGNAADEETIAAAAVRLFRHAVDHAHPGLLDIWLYPPAEQSEARG